MKTGSGGPVINTDTSAGTQRVTLSGGVFDDNALYIEVLGSTGSTCQPMCSTDAQGGGLSCALPPPCPGP